MSSIELSPARVFALKSAVRNDYPEVQSSHLSEAIAASLGYRTHASLKAEIVRYVENDAPFKLLDESRFLSRLKSLGYCMDSIDEDFSFDFYDSLGVINTTPSTAYDIQYRSKRDKAWRNLIVLTVNTALERKLFSLRPGDNRWEGWKVDNGGRSTPASRGCFFDFLLPSGKSARGYVDDAGFHELDIHVAVNPRGDFVASSYPGFAAGDTFAAAWLERDRGAWLQTSLRFNCRRHLVDELAGMEVIPNGFGDKGSIIM